MNDTSPPSPTNPNPKPPPYSLYPSPPYQSEGDEINLLDYWRVLVAYKIMIISLTVLTTLIVLAVAFLMTPIYRAEILLAPVSDDEQSSLSAIASQFGSLASLAGIKLGSGTDTTNQALATLTSKSFIGSFVDEKQLMPILFADEWDPVSNKWNVESPDDIPTKLDAYKLFQEDILNLTSDKDTGLVTLAIEWKDPRQAALWANELVNRLNHYEQLDAITEAEQSIAYLNKQLAKTSVIEVQQAIFNLVEAQTKTIMLANIREQYAFKVIDPAVPPEKKQRPKRALMTVLGFIGGFTISVILAFFMSSMASVREHEMKRMNDLQDPLL